MRVDLSQEYDHPLLLQVRVRVIDGQLLDDFERWYPGFPSNASTTSLAA
jgi:hypothetical protein